MLRWCVPGMVLHMLILQRQELEAGVEFVFFRSSCQYVDSSRMCWRWRVLNIYPCPHSVEIGYVCYKDMVSSTWSFWALHISQGWLASDSAPPTHEAIHSRQLPSHFRTSYSRFGLCIACHWCAPGTRGDLGPFPCGHRILLSQRVTYFLQWQQPLYDEIRSFWFNASDLTP